MDMKCMRCGEPWDWWYIRDEVLRDESHFRQARRSGGLFKCEPTPEQLELDDMPRFEPGFVTDKNEADWRFSPGPYIEECPACIHDPDVEPDEKAFYRAAIADMLGDDVDGFIAECEDWGL